MKTIIIETVPEPTGGRWYVPTTEQEKLGHTTMDRLNHHHVFDPIQLPLLIAKLRGSGFIFKGTRRSRIGARLKFGLRVNR